MTAALRPAPGPAPGPAPAAPGGRSPRPRLGTAGLRVAECLLGLAAVCLAAGPFAAFYDGVAALPWLAGAAALAGTAAAVCLLTHRPWWATAVVVVVVVLATAHTAGYAPLGVKGLPTVASLRAFGSGLATGLPKMLAIGLPADFGGDLVVPPVLLLGAAGAVTVVLLLGTRRVTPVALPAVVVLVAGLALTASRGGNRLLLTGALVLVLTALLVLRSNRVSVAENEGISVADADAVGVDLDARRRRSTYGRVALGLPVAAAVTALAVVGAWVLPIAPGAHRADPRSLYRAPFVVNAVLSPLVQVRPQLLGPDQPLFTVAVHDDTTPPLDRVRVAALDTYNGGLWTRSRDFQVTGTTLPDPQLPAGRATRVRLDVTVRQLPQPFLPVTGEPVRYDGSDFAFDRATDTAVSTRTHVAAFHYSTTAAVRQLDRGGADAVPSRTPADRADTVLPNPPPWVDTLLAQIVEGRTTPLGQLLAIETFLRNQQFNRQAPPGHSYGAVYRVLLGPPGGRVGSAEQFASAFALLARAAGFPTRVAVGYLLRPEQRQGGVYRVTTHDAYAWPEVHLQGYGWVPFEPTPPVEVPNPPRDTALSLESVDRAQAASATVPGRAARPAPQASPLHLVGLVAAAVAAALVVLLVLVVLLKWLRRRRRSRHGPPERRVLGAWREVTDRLTEAGVRVPASRTGSEVARDLAGGPAAPVARHVAELAPLVAGTVFAFEEPDQSAAQRAWLLEDRIRRELRAALPVAVRLRAVVDPRPLLPRLRWRRPRTGSVPRRARAAERTGAPS